ncbi:MAG: Radical SAM protein [uncultured bacterium]|nr:MAG: Radical SAM protein [uncultured bacterium]
MKENKHFITDYSKFILYNRIAITVAWKYFKKPSLFKWSIITYVRFLMSALRLLLVFRHHKVVKVKDGYKLDLYLPAFPSRAFYWALEGKLINKPPSPVTVVYSMTKACTYHCSHCYQKKDENKDLEENLMIETARKLQNMGVAMFDIEGGEPFVRYERLINLIKALDNRSEIWINTTGAGIKQEMLEQLKEAGLFGFMVSIHSPQEQKHDAFTGVSGSFQIACNTIKKCRSLGLVGVLNSVLSEEEIQSGGLSQLMDLSKTLDADFVQLIHPKPAGLWLGRETNMQMESALIDFIKREHLRYNGNLFIDYPSLSAQVFEESEQMLGCTSGAVDRFYVNASGEIQPCEFLNISFGNVKEEPLEDIFKRMRGFFDVPASDWLCCTQGAKINELLKRHQLKSTPLPWSVTQTLIKTWDRGKPTSLYQKLGIYS